MAQRQPKSLIISQARKSRQNRVHGPQATCADCGETDTCVLVTRSRPKRCETCYRKAKGVVAFDDHHPAGRANSALTVKIDASGHRKLTDMQNDWEVDTLRNASGDPLRTAAAKLRGFKETMTVTLESFVGWIIQLLEALSEWLTNERGPHWWAETPLDRFAVCQ